VLAGCALSRERRGLRLALAAGTATLAFLIAMPYALLDFPSFRDGVRFVLTERAGVHWRHLGRPALYPLWRGWPWVAGEAMLALAALGALCGGARRPRLALPAALLAATVYASYALSGSDYVRYALPAVPALATLAALPLAIARSRAARAAGGL